MEPTTLHYKAPPGQIALGDLYNTEPAHIAIKGYAIPAHPNNEGWLERPGFDIISIQLERETEFASAQALVYADAGRELHWRQCQQAVQWADEQAGK